MILVKTEVGQQAFKERQGVLLPRQRPAFILFDGKRGLQQVLDATAAMGITAADIWQMLDAGLLAHSSPASEVKPSSVAQEVPVGADGGRSPAERYQEAYLVAAELTAGLGLRGFRLHLAVEGATGIESLLALAPRIHEAVGDAKYERLRQALLA